MTDAELAVIAMYKAGKSNDEVAEWLFGPQWMFAATPKDGWVFNGERWCVVARVRVNTLQQNGEFLVEYYERLIDLLR